MPDARAFMCPPTTPSLEAHRHDLTIPAPPPLPHGLTVGWRIRDARERHGMKRSFLAARIGKSHKAISHYENGTAYPPRDVLALLAKELGLPIEALIP